MQLHKRKPKQTPFVSSSVLMALLLALLLSGCVTQPQQPPSPPTPSVRLQPLPQSARQGDPPPECLQTCLSKLTSMREQWQQRLNAVAWPDSSAKPSTTQP